MFLSFYFKILVQYFLLLSISVNFIPVTYLQLRKKDQHIFLSKELHYLLLGIYFQGGKGKTKKLKGMFLCGLILKLDSTKYFRSFLNLIFNLNLFIILIFIYLFIWLCWVLVAAGGIFVVVCGIFTVACGIFSCSMRALVPWAGIEPGPLHWEYGVLNAGPPGKSQEWFLLCTFSFLKSVFKFSNHLREVDVPCTDLSTKREKWGL